MQIIFFLSWPKKNNAPDSIPVASPSRDRALWVGLSLERGTIAAATATASRKLQGQHRSSVSRSRGAGGYVDSYGNAIDLIKMHAHQNVPVTHFIKSLHSRLNSILHFQSRLAKSLSWCGLSSIFEFLVVMDVQTIWCTSDKNDLFNATRMTCYQCERSFIGVA